MKNKDVITYYDKMAASIKTPTETRNKAKDFSKYDIEFMLKRASKQKRLLDLGSGTGLLVNHLIGHYKDITAVEKYPNFSKFINADSNVNVINANLIGLELNDDNFDILSLFGVMNYFDDQEAESIYRNIHRYLKMGGELIIKNQFGVKEDVIVNGYSEEIGCDYFSNYRQLDKEIHMLKSCGFDNIECFDIYPAEYNRWDNTHFYALTANKVHN